MHTKLAKSCSAPAIVIIGKEMSDGASEMQLSVIDARCVR